MQPFESHPTESHSSSRSQPPETGGAGADLIARIAPFAERLDARVAQGGFPFSRRLLTEPGPEATVRLVDGSLNQGINFGSQDPLNLATHPDVKAAAIAAIEQYGVHGAGASLFSGATALSDQLEEAMAEFLRMPYVTLSPTGWSAGYGLVRALVRDTDHVIIDQFAHNGLQEGANAATRHVHVFRHLDVGHARLKLSSVRARHPHGGILVVTESLFPMSSDAADLAGFQSLCREFGARLAVSVAHDFGGMGPDGTGNLGAQNMLGRVDLVVGSFAKVFASNGGFVAAHRREVRDYLRHVAPPAAFSGALAPAQMAAALAAVRIARSAEGEQRRRRLLEATHAVRSELIQRGVEVLGVASPLVPVLIGRDELARAAARLLAGAGVIANLMEYPRVSRASARLLLQMMSAHTPAMCATAAARIADAVRGAREACRQETTATAA